MEDNNHNSNTQPQAVAGPSGLNRKRDRSSSSSSATSVSSSSTSTSGSKQARSKNRRRHKKRKRARRSGQMDKLFKEIGELRKQINTTSNIDTACCDNASVFSGISGQLYEQISDEDCSNQELQNTSLDFTFDIDTKLKEPLVPKTPESFLKKLVDIQRFGSTSWSEVRYADTQKLYNHTPGFIDLETNEEVKAYDTLRHLAHADKSYAALTYCILKQRQSLQEGIRDLLSWAKNTECISFDNLNGKIDELFQKGEFHKISSDLLQLACGHRAESIEMRRETITSQVRDPLVKAFLNKIPPSSTYIFNAEPFTSTLEKAGGVRKAFWPPKTERSSQKPYQPSSRPSRGQGARKPPVPSRGTPFHEPGSHTHTCHNPPSRGDYHGQCQHTHTSSRGNSSGHCDHFNSRSSFRNRGSRPERGSTRGRANSSKSSRGKRYKQ